MQPWVQVDHEPSPPWLRLMGSTGRFITPRSPLNRPMVTQPRFGGVFSLSRLRRGCFGVMLSATADFGSAKRDFFVRCTELWPIICVQDALVRYAAIHDAECRLLHAAF